MYPAHYLGLFPPFPREDRIFVAMSFADQFVSRWEQVLRPAIEMVTFDGKRQVAYRVDVGQIGDSILTEILEGISRSRIVIADVTTIGLMDGKPVRNANVLYEVGIAHASRLPEEVILFRSDTDHLMFDIGQVRVHQYNPDGDPGGARRLVAETVVSVLKEIDLRRHLSIRQASSTLDNPSWMVLLETAGTQGIKHPVRKTMGQALGNQGRSDAIARLLDVGAIEMQIDRISSDTIRSKGLAAFDDAFGYHISAFGRALVAYGLSEIGLSDPGVAQAWRDLGTQLQTSGSNAKAAVEGTP